jgi:DNA-binding NtrC family response regulator
MAEREAVMRTDEDSFNPSAIARRAFPGDSDEVTTFRRRIVALGNSSTPVLIEGDNDGSHERAARLLHGLSRSLVGALVSLDLQGRGEIEAAMMLFGYQRRQPDNDVVRAGLFDDAHRGTILLANVDRAPPSIQRMLVEVIATGRFTRLGGRMAIRSDARVIATSRCELSLAVRRGWLNEELARCFEGGALASLPLWRRPEDVPAIAEQFLSELGAAVGRHAPTLSEPAARAMSLYDWPGNLCELEEIVCAAFAGARGSTIEVDDLPARIVEEIGVRYHDIDLRRSPRSTGCGEAALDPR